MSGQCRVLLLGKTGCGKSSLGNLLTGRRSFPVSSGMIASETVDCQECTSEDTLWTVVDTPDVTEQIGDPAAVKKLLSQACGLIKRGAFDAVLLVTRLDVRFTQEERQVLETLTRALGSDYGNRCSVVFTHGDCIGNDDDKFKEKVATIRGQVAFMDGLIAQCKERVAVVDLGGRCPAEVTARQEARLRQLCNISGGEPGLHGLALETTTKSKKQKTPRKKKQQKQKQVMNSGAQSHRKKTRDRKRSSFLFCVASKTKD